MKTGLTEEMRRFKEALPNLMAGKCAGRWVVFKDGEVKSTHDDEAAAFHAGLEAFGTDGGHLVIQVAEPQVIRLNAFSAFL